MEGHTHTHAACSPPNLQSSSVPPMRAMWEVVGMGGFESCLVCVVWDKSVRGWVIVQVWVSYDNHQQKHKAPACRWWSDESRPWGCPDVPRRGAKPTKEKRWPLLESMTWQLSPMSPCVEPCVSWLPWWQQLRASHRYWRRSWVGWLAAPPRWPPAWPLSTPASQATTLVPSQSVSFTQTLGKDCVV